MQRAPGVRQIGVTFKTLYHAKTARLTVFLKHGPKLAHLDLDARAARVAATGVRMQQRQLRYEHALKVAQLGTRAYTVEQGLVFAPHAFPVDAVHIRVPEVIPVQAPGIGVDLVPLRTFVDCKAPIFELHLSLI